MSMDKFNFLKKYIKSYTVQIILLLNYFGLWSLVKCIKGILETHTRIESCGNYFCYEVVEHFFIGVWLTILALNIIFLFIFYNLEKFLRIKISISERCQPAKFQCLCFFMGLFALSINILSVPLFLFFATIYDLVAFMLLP